MSSFRVAICQIPLRLLRSSSRVADLPAHACSIEKCFSIAREHEADYVVIPEYAYDPSLEQLYKEHSRRTSIIGGSFRTSQGYNRTVIAVGGKISWYDKISLSPLEKHVKASRSVKSSNNPPICMYGTGQELIGVLTCSDYFHLARDVACKKNVDGRWIDILFSPSCNPSPKVFFKEAEALHLRRSSLYSIIANVSSLAYTERAGRQTQARRTFGGSAVFGLHSKDAREQLEGEGLRDQTYEQMILKLPDKDCVGILTLELEYNRYPMPSLEFKKNPQDVLVVGL